MIRLKAICALFAAFILPLNQAHASRVVALLLGNDTAVSEDVAGRLERFQESLFRFGDDSVLINGINLSKQEMLERAGSFHRQIQSANVVIVYFTGQTVHNRNGQNFIVPKDWSGREDGLVDMKSLLEPARTIKGGALVFIDTPTSLLPSRTMDGLLVGLSNLEREVGSSAVQVAYSSSGRSNDRAAKSLALLTSLEQRIKPERLTPTKLAALVQEDVSFDSGGHYVPRVSALDRLLPDLQSVRNDELEGKKGRCVAERGSAGVPTGFAGTTDRSTQNVAAMNPADIQLAAVGSEYGRSRKPSSLWWFCPPLREVKPAPESKPQTEEPRRVRVTPPKPKPPVAEAPSPRRDNAQRQQTNQDQPRQASVPTQRSAPTPSSNSSANAAKQGSTF